MLLFLCANNSFSQSTFYFEHYTTKDGLSQSYVYSILQDKNGFMWFGTQAGVDRFDGLRFVSFLSKEKDTNTICTGFVNVLYEQLKKNLLWVGTSSGICNIDLSNGYKARQYILDTFREQNVISIKESNARVIALSNENIFYQDGNGKFRTYAKIDSGLQYYDFIASNDTFLFATNKGVYVLDFNAHKILGRLSVIVTKFQQDQGETFFITKRKIYGINSNLIHKIFAGEKKFDTLGTTCSLSIENSTCVLKNNDDYFVGASNGLYINQYIIPKNKSFAHHYNLSNEEILSAYKSRDNTIWIGTKGGGINKLVSKRPFFLNYCSDKDVWSIFPNPYNNNYCYVGTAGNGLQQISLLTDSSGINIPLSINGANESFVRVVNSIKGKILIGGRKGLYTDKISNSPQNYNIKKIFGSEINRVFSLAVTKKYVWVGALDTIVVINSTLDTVLRKIPISSSRKKIVRHISPAKIKQGKSWVEGNSVWVASDEGVVRISLTDDRTFLVDTTFRGERINYVCQDSNLLWLGSLSNGAFCIDLINNTTKNFTKTDGLLDNAIYGITKDKFGMIWISSNLGINLLNHQTNSFNNYDWKNGLLNEEFNAGACYNTDSCIFFGGVKGLNLINSNDFWSKDSSYGVCLLVYPTTTSINPNVIKLPIEKFDVDPLQSYTRIDLRIFSFQDVRNNKYVYQVGNDNWSNEQSITESILIPRNKLRLFLNNPLKIKLRSSNGKWSSPFTININVPLNGHAIYKDSEFGVYFLILIILLAVAFIVFRERRRYLTLQKKDDELSQYATSLEKKNIEVHSLNQDLIENENYLRQLQDYINEISRCTGVKEIIHTGIKHLLHPSIFNFDFVVFYEINYNKNQVRIGNYRCKNKKIFHPKYWKKFRKALSLDSSDVVAIAARTDEIVAVNGWEINIEGNSIVQYVNAEEDYYRKIKQDELEYLLIPVRYRKKRQDSIHVNDKTLALLQVGYHITSTYTITNEDKTRLKIYADNFAQSYKNLINNENDDAIHLILDKCDKESSDNPGEYLKNILFETCELVDAHKGLIVVLSGNHNRIMHDEIQICYNVDDWEKDEIIQHSDTLFSEAILSKSYSLSNAKTSTNDFWRNNYGVAIPIRYDKIIIGCVLILAKTENFFDRDNIRILHRIVNGIGKIFSRKKFHTAVEELVIPDNILSNPYENFVPIIKALKSYFNTNYVSVWLRDYEKSEVEFKQYKASHDIERMCENYGKKNKIFRTQLLENRIIKLNTPEPHLENEQFWQFAKEHEMKSLIYVPLRIDTGQYGFINIYSRREFNSNLLERDDRLLNIICNKAMFSFLCSSMINVFSEISQSIFEENLSGILKQISIAAKDILHSDPVIIFRFDEAHNIIYNNIIYSGKLYEEKKIYRKSKTNFIESSLEDNDPFYPSEDDLPESYRLVVKNPKNDSFWRREKISSLAAIPLKQGKKVLGVMCFNYRQKQSFPEVTKQLIRAFASLASAAIGNKIQENELKNRAEKLRFEYEDIYQKMQDMLPTATRTSLLDIIRQINHDIINGLLEIKADLVSLTSRLTKNKFSDRDKEAILNNIESVKRNISNSRDLIKLFKPLGFRNTDEDINQIIIDVSKLFQNRFTNSTNKIEIDLSGLTKEGMQDITCSKAEIAMVVYNLISNSVKAIGEKVTNSIVAPAGNENPNFKGVVKISSFYLAKEKKYCLEVYDNGVGIDKKDLERIYEPGFTTRAFEKDLDDYEKVHGIGLYFVKESIKNNYGGTIECESYKGNYTIFKITLKSNNSSK